MPRLFTALSLPDGLREKLTRFQGGLPSARWIEPDDLHLTLRFFGDMSGPEALELSSGLHQIKVRPFPVVLQGLGYFGGKAPRMAYIGAQPSPELTALQKAHESLAQRLGFAPEGRKFTPHVTLARLRNINPGAVMSYISQHALTDVGPDGFAASGLEKADKQDISSNGGGALEFEVNGFALFSAKNSRGGGPYLIEERYEF